MARVSGAVAPLTPAVRELVLTQGERRRRWEEDEEVWCQMFGGRAAFHATAPAAALGQQQWVAPELDRWLRERQPLCQHQLLSYARKLRNFRHHRHALESKGWAQLEGWGRASIDSQFYGAQIIATRTPDCNIAIVLTGEETRWPSHLNLFLIVARFPWHLHTAR
ncbi:uncharacterized protein [Triticum aestivum]|uniref:uncharacterized protein isoform X1 n=1 Tax=Triticum aestivum TaxID=4565 RepID=UPI001D031434|nr:uncharacterized protein LOC123087094 isoform X1 [Triticum aestivum]